MMRLTACLLALLLTGCASQVAPPATVGSVDLQRYQGTWYEQARLPMFFQRNCAESESHYRLQDDGSVAVRNRCLTYDGEWQQAEGRAEPQQAGQTDKLWVRFDNWFAQLFPNVARGDYWVLYLDEGYQLALVGNPNREYLWLLSREQQISPAQRQLLLDQAHARGFVTDELIWRGARP